MTQGEIYFLSLFLSQIMPQLTELINKHIPTANIRFLASLLVTAIISLLFNWNQLSMGNWQTYALDALILWTGGQAAYKFYYDGSDQQNRIRYTTNPLPVKELIPDTAPLKSFLAGILKK